MAYITPNSSDSKYYDLYIQGDGRLYANRNSSYLFYRFEYLDAINNANILDTSYVNIMSNMFNSAGSNAWNWNVGNLSNWKTSNVTNMSGMFAFVGISDTSTLDCSTWDVNKVTSYSNFDSGDVELRITPPKWVN